MWPCFRRWPVPLIHSARHYFIFKPAQTMDNSRLMPAYILNDNFIADNMQRFLIHTFDKSAQIGLYR